MLCREFGIKASVAMTCQQQEGAIRHALADKVEKLGFAHLNLLQRKAFKAYNPKLSKIGEPNFPKPPPRNPSAKKDVVQKPMRGTQQTIFHPRTLRLRKALLKYGIKDNGKDSDNQLWGRVNKKARENRQEKTQFAHTIAASHPTPKQESHMSTKVISFINLKGGVAKTTTTVGTAECLAAQGHKVLVIDLDPQTNATIMLLGEQRWLDLNERGDTLATLFDDVCNTRSRFNVERAQALATCCAREAEGRLFVLPSSLDLITKQDELAKHMSGPYGTVNTVEVLLGAVEPILGNYDYVLVDCPPSLNQITLNGLRISDGYVIPCIPDILSTYGIPQVIQGISKFAQAIGKALPCLGVVPTKVRSINVHKEQLQTLQAERDAPLFGVRFQERGTIASAANPDEGRTLKGKWGDMQREFDHFVIELKARLS